jgi:hypothetical protein
VQDAVAIHARWRSFGSLKIAFLVNERTNYLLDALAPHFGFLCVVQLGRFLGMNRIFCAGGVAHDLGGETINKWEQRRNRQVIVLLLMCGNCRTNGGLSLPHIGDYPPTTHHLI